MTNFSEFDVSRVFEMRLSSKMPINAISQSTGISHGDIAKILNNPIWRKEAIRKKYECRPKKPVKSDGDDEKYINRNEALETKIIGEEAEKLWAQRMGSLRWDVKRPDWAIHRI
jgi:hypothetical protein